MASRVLVEGPDDKHVFMHLLLQHGIQFEDLNVDIKDKGGFTPLLKSLPVELRASDVSRVAIIVDADTSINQRWQSVRDTLRNCGYLGVPDRPEAAGTVIVEAEKLTVGLWIVPNNQIEGILEDFVATLVPSDDRLWHRALDAVAGIPPEDRRFSPQSEPKARVCTWLAWQEEPGARMGEALNLRYFDPHTAQATVFIGWFRRFLES